MVNSNKETKGYVGGVMRNFLGQVEFQVNDKEYLGTNGGKDR